jgi:nucleoside-diphosphate-sugar epimerase
MKVMIIGGTGFLGYHATRVLLDHAHKITVVGLPPSPPAGLFPTEVAINICDIAQLTDPDLSDLMHGHDAIVFAAGVDDRTTPKKPAYPFFLKHNVESVRRVFNLARQAGIRRGVVLGSYFAHFDHLWPEMELPRHHPYIRSRVEQADAAIEAGGEGMEVCILELPYIFGSMTGRVPLWKPLISYILSPFPLFYPAGGTTCVTVQQVARAICGAVERGRAGARYPIGGENLTWVQLLGRISTLAGKPKQVITLPNRLVKAGAWLLRLMHTLQGRESGLEPVSFIDLQTRNTFIDREDVRLELNYTLEELDNALLDTLKACQLAG